MPSNASYSIVFDTWRSWITTVKRLVPQYEAPWWEGTQKLSSMSIKENHVQCTCAQSEVGINAFFHSRLPGQLPVCLWKCTMLRFLLRSINKKVDQITDKLWKRRITYLLDKYISCHCHCPQATPIMLIALIYHIVIICWEKMNSGSVKYVKSEPFSAATRKSGSQQRT
jgi:hypothetical protein